MGLLSLPGARTWLWSQSYRLGPGTFYRPAYAHIADAVAPQLGAMLDVGCGPGGLCVAAADGRPELDVVGIDTCREMIGFAKRQRKDLINCSFREMNGEAIVFPDDTFHAVTAIQTVHHWVDLSAVLVEVFRVLVPSCSAYIYDADPEAVIPADWIARKGPFPTNDNLRRRWRSHSLDETQWQQLLQLATDGPFGAYEVDQHGFYRRLILTKPAVAS